MCVNIYFQDDDEYCDSVGELREKLGVLFWGDNYSTDNDDHCLCGLDIKETLDHAGYHALFENSMDVMAVKK